MRLFRRFLEHFATNAVLVPCFLQYLEEEYRKGAREDDPMPPVQPYHYGSHYSNSGTVLHFLVRMPPFTKMFLAYQGKDFGNAFFYFTFKVVNVQCGIGFRSRI